MQKIFRETQILYLALLIGQLIFAIVTAILISGENPIVDMTASGGDYTSLVTMLTAVFALIILATYFINHNRRKQGAQLSSLEAKLGHYRQTVLIRSAMVEGANLLMIIAALVTGAFNYLMYFGLGLLAYLYFRPSVSGIAMEYQLTEEEKRRLESR